MSFGMSNLLACLGLIAFSNPASAAVASWIDDRYGVEIGSGFYAVAMLTFISAAAVCFSAAVRGKYPWEEAE